MVTVEIFAKYSDNISHDLALKEENQTSAGDVENRPRRLVSMT